MNPTTPNIPIEQQLVQAVQVLNGFSNQLGNFFGPTLSNEDYSILQERSLTGIYFFKILIKQKYLSHIS